MDNLNVIDFTSKDKRKGYRFEAGLFYLKPPYMYLVDKVQPLAAKLIDAQDVPIKQENDLKEYKKIVDTFIKILRLILEETNEGTLQDITIDNLRIDVAKEILNDFFMQYKQ
jgi:hypothetical protein